MDKIYKIHKKLRLAVFPSDDLEDYIKKGEVRKNYYNPNDMFSEIFIFNMSEEKKIDSKYIQFMCGKAKFKIIFLGSYTVAQKIFKLRSIAEKALPMVQEIKPDCIRTYGILFNSYIAAYCSRNTNTPLLLSLHDNYDGTREIAIKSGEYMNYLFYVFWKYTRERWIVKSATHVVAMYDYAKLYATDNGVPEKKIDVIYNKVDTESFKKLDAQKYKTFTVINVMRQNWMKKQEILVRAVAPLKDVNLLLIGGGPLHEQLKNLAKSLGCSDRVIFIKSVMNKDLPKYYRKSHVFATAVVQRGVGIPVLESLSSGIPVIHAKYVEEEKAGIKSDIISDYAYMVDNNPKSFGEAITKLKDDRKTYNDYVKKCTEFRKKINMKTMSDKEEKMYRKMLSSK